MSKFSFESPVLSSKRELIVINGSGLGESLGIKMSRFIPPWWCRVSDGLEIGDTRWFMQDHSLVWSIPGPLLLPVLYLTSIAAFSHSASLMPASRLAWKRKLFIGYWKRRGKYYTNDLVTFLKCFCQLNCGLCIERSGFKILNWKRILGLIKVSIRTQFKLFKVTTIGYTQWTVSKMHMSTSSNILEMFLPFCWVGEKILFESPHKTH